MDNVEGTDWKIASSRLALRRSKEGPSQQTAGVQRCLSTAGKGWGRREGPLGPSAGQRGGQGFRAGRWSRREKQGRQTGRRRDAP